MSQESFPICRKKTRDLRSQYCFLLFLGLAICFSFAFAEQTSDAKPLNVWGMIKYLPQGETLNFPATLEPGHTPTAIELTPAEGITAGEWTLVKNINVNRSVWACAITIQKNATLGEREIVVVTQDGKTAPEKIMVVTHIPVISDFKVNQIQLRPAQIKFSFKVFDRFDDLPDLKKKVIWFILSSPGQFIAFQASPVNVTKIEKGTFLVEFNWSGINQYFVEGTTCELSFDISDTNGYCAAISTTVNL